MSGPTSHATLSMTEFRPIALGRSRSPTSRGWIACRVGRLSTDAIVVIPAATSYSASELRSISRETAVVLFLLYLASLVAISITRELGPLVAAIVVIGRSGSAFAAQIGTMRVTEELDALEA